MLSPLVRAVDFVCSAVLDLAGRTHPEVLRHEEYLSYLDSAREQGIFSQAEAALLKDVLHLRNKRVEDVMQSRMDLTWLKETTPAEEAADIIRKSRQAYLPVSAGTLDEADRLLSARAFFNLEKGERERWAQSAAVFHTAFLPDTTVLPKALHVMKTQHLEAAMAADEYGGLNGMLTLADIYSVLAGKSVDPNSTPDNFNLQITPNCWIFDGASPMDFVRENSAWKTFDPDHEGYESNTLSGVLCEELGSIPRINESVRVGDAVLTVLSVSKNRAKRIRVEVDEPRTSGKAEEESHAHAGQRKEEQES